MAADPYVNFASFDTGDHALTCHELHIVVVVAGGEAADSSPSPSVYAHRWWLDTSVPAPVLDGVTVCDGSLGGSYAQMGEMQPGHMATIGGPCHELGHDLGLPDLYDTGTGPGEPTSFGIGVYCLMSYGCWAQPPARIWAPRPCCRPRGAARARLPCPHGNDHSRRTDRRAGQ